MEHQVVYHPRDRVLFILAHLGIQYTELRPEQTFLWNMFECPAKTSINLIH